MNEAKPWYLSRTIWASVVTILMALAGLFEGQVEGIEHAGLTDAILQVVSAAAGLTAIMGRLFARERIG